MLSARQKWLVTVNQLPNPRLRLFCFPYSGGAAHIFSKWPQRLPHDIEVVAIQPPGRSSRFTEPLLSNIQPMVEGAFDAIRTKLDRPFALFGHSVGGAVAFEICRKMEAEGLFPEVLIPSGRNAPHVKMKKKQLHLLSEAEFTEEIKTFNGTPEAVLENPELMELMIPILKADFTISETYVYQAGPKLQTPIRAIGGQTDTHVKSEGIEGWQQYTRGLFQSNIVEGDHFFIHGEATEFFETLNCYLDFSNHDPFESGDI